jgi:23S rRNA (cytosine1962-C5)-methyltransferase
MKNKSDWIDRNLLRDFADEGTDAHRLATADAGWVERFGRDILISYKHEPVRAQLTSELDEWCGRMGSAYERVFARFLPRKNEERQRPRLVIANVNGSLQTITTERHLRFGIDFTAGYSTGLFLDQRENRSHLRRIAPRRLLNCFAYTCSFSVAAASVGALTLNIDLSSKSLGRGRDNFALNSLPTVDQRFIADDVFAVLPRLARRGEKFDAIILDPPTFSRSHEGKAFQVERDFEKLLLGAVELAERKASILLSTNCSALHGRALEVLGRYCLKVSQRTGSFHRTHPLPDFPEGAGATSVWLTLR